MNEQKLLSQEYSMESYGMLDAGDFLPPPLLPEAKWFPQENHFESLTHNPSIWKAQKLVPKNVQNDQVTRAEEERGECIVSDLNFQNLVWHTGQIYPTSPMNVVEGGQEWVILNDFDEEIYLLGAGSPTAKGCVRFTERSRVWGRWIRGKCSVICSLRCPLEPRSAPEEKDSALVHHLTEGAYDGSPTTHPINLCPFLPVPAPPSLWPWRSQKEQSEWRRAKMPALLPMQVSEPQKRTNFKLDKWDWTYNTQNWRSYGSDTYSKNWFLKNLIQDSTLKAVLPTLCQTLLLKSIFLCYFISSIQHVSQISFLLKLPRLNDFHL